MLHHTRRDEPLSYTFITLFPEIIENYFSYSVLRRAQERKIITINIVFLRAFGIGKHKQCDDLPYGGGAGMVLMPEPLKNALESIDDSAKYVVCPSPSGTLFNTASISSLKQKKHTVFICGRYEGIDQRIIDSYVDEEISIGNYVLSSGDLAALVIADAIIRTIDGVISPDSLREESFQHNLLEYPHYTRPHLWNGLPVPDVLLSGNHKDIQSWREKEGRKKTMQNRPDM